MSPIDCEEVFIPERLVDVEKQGVVVARVYNLQSPGQQTFDAQANLRDFWTK
jgi:hypothetical protein